MKEVFLAANASYFSLRSEVALTSFPLLVELAVPLFQEKPHLFIVL